MGSVEGGEPPRHNGHHDRVPELQQPEPTRVIPTRQRLAELFDPDGRLGVDEELKSAALGIASRIIDLPGTQVEKEADKLDKLAREQRRAHPVLAAYADQQRPLRDRFDFLKRSGVSREDALDDLRRELISRSVAERLIQTAGIRPQVITARQTPNLYDLYEATWKAADTALQERSARASGQFPTKE